MCSCAVQGPLRVSHCGRMEIDLVTPVAVLLESRDYAIATISEEDYEQRATGWFAPGPVGPFGPDGENSIFRKAGSSGVDLPERQVYSRSKWAKIPKNLNVGHSTEFSPVWVIKSRRHVAGAA